jgi:hypothetical protein
MRQDKARPSNTNTNTNTNTTPPFNPRRKPILPGTISSLTITNPELIQTITKSLADHNSPTYLAAFASSSPSSSFIGTSPLSASFGNPENATPFDPENSYDVGSMLQVHSIPGAKRIASGMEGIEEDTGGGEVQEVRVGSAELNCIFAP